MLKSREIQKRRGSFSDNESVDTPFMKGKMEWDSRIKATSDNTKAWRFVGSLLAITLFGSVYMNISLLSQRNIEVNYVGYDRNQANVLYVGPIREVDFTDNHAIISKELRDVVRWIRSIPSDLVVAQENWKTAYARFSANVATRFNADHRNRSPLDEVGTLTRQVRFNSVLPVGKNTFQLQWEEVEYDKNGNSKAAVSYTGLFSFYFKVPETREELLINPMGFRISDFQFEEDL